MPARVQPPMSGSELIEMTHISGVSDDCGVEIDRIEENEALLAARDSLNEVHFTGTEEELGLTVDHVNGSVIRVTQGLKAARLGVRARSANIAVAIMLIGAIILISG